MHTPIQIVFLNNLKWVSHLLAKCVHLIYIGDDPTGGTGGAADYEGTVPGSGQGQD